MASHDPKRVNPDGPGRRRFLAGVARTACGVGIAGMLLGLLARQTRPAGMGDSSARRP